MQVNSGGIESFSKSNREAKSIIKSKVPGTALSLVSNQVVSF